MYFENGKYAFDDKVNYALEFRQTKSPLCISSPKRLRIQPDTFPLSIMNPLKSNTKQIWHFGKLLADPSWARTAKYKVHAGKRGLVLLINSSILLSVSHLVSSVKEAASKAYAAPA